MSETIDETAPPHEEEDPLMDLVEDSEAQGQRVRIDHGQGTAINLYYRLYGSGPTKILLVMGLSTTYKAWMHQISYFSREEHRDQFQVCVFDNRGTGRSDAPSGRYTTKMMAHDAYSLVTDTLGWEKVHVAGVSMGGMISQELALLLGDRLASLALIVTHAGGRHAIVPFSGAAMIVRNMMRDDEQRAQAIVTGLHSEKWRLQMDEHGVTNEEKTKRRFMRRMSKDPKQPGSGALGQFAACSTHYVSASRLRMIKDLAVPILIIVGTWDTLVRVKNSYSLARFLDPAEFLVCQGAGHGIITEAAEDVSDALLRNIRRGLGEDVPVPTSSPRRSLDDEEEEDGADLDDDYGDLTMGEAATTQDGGPQAIMVDVALGSDE